DAWIRRIEVFRDMIDGQRLRRYSWFTAFGKRYQLRFRNAVLGDDDRLPGCCTINQGRKMGFRFVEAVMRHAGAPFDQLDQHIGTGGRESKPAQKGRYMRGYPASAATPQAVSVQRPSSTACAGVVRGG